MKIAILGYGKEGKSVMRFLRKSREFKSAGISILDKKIDPDYLDRLPEFDLVFRSPGVPYNLPQIRKAIKKGIEFSSATKLFFDLCPAKIIGITGTKGKSTTATLIHKILKNCGFDARLAGNIGKPTLDILNKINNKSLVVLELSSFQLQDLHKSSCISVVTDVFPDHLDAHKNLREYLEAKFDIARHQKKTDVIFYFNDNELSAKIAGKSPARKIPVSGAPFGLKKNILMAASVCAFLGCPPEKINKTVTNFKGVSHRLNLVCDKKGVCYYNDSASTNPHTAAMALRSLPQNQPVILIAGGKDKNLDYAPLADALKKSTNARLLILMGENKNKIAKAVKAARAKTKIIFAKNMLSAIKLAKRNAVKGTNIVLSPGSASFDMFMDYKDRGKQFVKIVKTL